MLPLEADFDLCGMEVVLISVQNNLHFAWPVMRHRRYIFIGFVGLIFVATITTMSTAICVEIMNAPGQSISFVLS